MKLQGARGWRGRGSAALRPSRVVFIALLMSAGLHASPAASGEDARLRDVFARSVRTAEGDFSVLLHASSSRSLGETLADVRHTGMSIGTVFRFVDAFVAHGNRDQIRAASALPTVERIEANTPIAYATDTSHMATRGRALLKGKFRVEGRKITGAGVGVAVVDSGIDGTHPDLAPNMGGNFKVVCTTTEGLYDPSDPNDYGSCRGPVVVVPASDTDTISAGGHGTHVAGIVAGTGTASEGRFHGAAPDATLYGISAGSGANLENVTSALEWVLENHDKVSPPIKVINASWGSGAGGSPDAGEIIWRIQDLLVEEGITLVFVAHNYGGDGEISQTAGECINPTPGVICVADYSDDNSGTRSGSISATSSRGAAADPRTWPDLSAPGTSITSTCRLVLPVCWLGAAPHADPPNSYSSLSGTSMAAPHVAGIVAQLLQANPTLSPAAMEDILEDTAHKFSYGAPYGRDPANHDDTSSFDKGHGLVDALAATREAVRR